MVQDVAKCVMVCDKEDCMYKHSQGSEYNFKYFCIDGSAYCKKFDDGAIWRETEVVEEVVEIEQGSTTV